jgi:hypothetical protein
LPGDFLPNPSVELDEDQNSIPDGWLLGGNDPSGDIWDDSRPVSGQRNLLLQDTGDDNYTSWYTNVELPEDVDELQFRWTWAYEFTSDNPGDEFRMTIAWRSAGADLTYDHVVVRDDQLDYLTEDRMFFVPEGADALRLEFVTGGPQTETGVMYVDDISIAAPGVALPGDFNQDGQLDARDIDLLTRVVVQGTNDPSFNLNTDGVVNGEDRRVWVEELRRTYFGDSNLDGEFSSTDFVVVFQAGQYEDTREDNSTWATGDWNGDLEFDSGDFVVAFQAGGFERGPRAAVHSVPEPLSIIYLFSVGILLAGSARKSLKGWRYASPGQVRRRSRVTSPWGSFVGRLT